MLTCTLKEASLLNYTMEGQAFINHGRFLLTMVVGQYLLELGSTSCYTCSCLKLEHVRHIVSPGHKHAIIN